MRKATFLILALIFTAILPFQSPAADSTSFNPTSVVITANPGGVPIGTIITWPLASNPADAEKWLECNGQQVDPAVYPELAALMAYVPDYRDVFLRGGGAGDVGTWVADSVRGHAHGMDQHSHSLNGTAQGQTYLRADSANTAGSGGYYAVEGPRSPASSSIWDLNSYMREPYSVGAPVDNGGWSNDVGSVRQIGGGIYRRIDAVGANSGGVQFGGETFTTDYIPISGGAASMNYSYATSSASGVSGSTSMNGATSTHAYGDAETAPQHIRVRYLIRAMD